VDTHLVKAERGQPCRPGFHFGTQTGDDGEDVRRTRDDSAVNRYTGSLFVDVERLRVPNLGKFDDLFARDEPAAGLDDETDFVVFEVT